MNASGVHDGVISLELGIQVEGESYDCSFDYDWRRDDPKKTAEALVSQLAIAI